MLGGGAAGTMCVCGDSLEKSGDLSSSSARTAVFVLTFRNAGAARLYSRSVSSHNTRAKAALADSSLANVSGAPPSCSARAPERTSRDAVVTQRGAKLASRRSIGGFIGLGSPFSWLVRTQKFEYA